MGKNRDIALHRTYRRDDGVRPRDRVSRRLPTGTPIFKKIPSWAGSQNFLGLQALEFSIVPLPHIRLDFRATFESRKRTGAQCSLPRTAQDAVERHAAQTS